MLIQRMFFLRSSRHVKWMVAFLCCMSIACSAEIIFSEKKAFLMLFGNYDAINHSAIWKDIPFPKGEKLNLWRSRAGIVKKVFFQRYRESGKEKIFFLVKTVPKDTPYECHVCLPLISAVIFVKQYDRWTIEAKNLFLMYGGQYAESPKVKLIAIGKEKQGLILEFHYHDGESQEKETSLLVPYKNTIEIAYQDITDYDNFNSCYESSPCAAYSTKMIFHTVEGKTFYTLEMNKWGTRNDEKQHYKAIPVQEDLFFYLKNGKYSLHPYKSYPHTLKHRGCCMKE